MALGGNGYSAAHKLQPKGGFSAANINADFRLNNLESLERITMKSFSGTDFVTALLLNDLRPSLIVSGMVKPIEEKKESILFDRGGACMTWIEIPVDMIEKVDVLRYVRCKDHSHPYVRLTLKDVPKENTVASVFHSMLAADDTEAEFSSETLRESFSNTKDQECFNVCAKDCLGLVGAAKGACLRACRNDCRSNV